MQIFYPNLCFIQRNMDRWREFRPFHLWSDSGVSHDNVRGIASGSVSPPKIPTSCASSTRQRKSIPESRSVSHGVNIQKSPRPWLLTGVMCGSFWSRSSSGRRFHFPTVMRDFHGLQADSVTSISHALFATMIHLWTTVCQSYIFGRWNVFSSI